MPAAKATAAKKVAPTRRTAAQKKKVAPPPSEFDKARAKLIAERKPSETVFEWTAYGRTWHVQRPNPAVAAAFGDPEYDLGLMEYITGHVIPTERVDFMKALLADDELDLDTLRLIIDSIESVVYDIPLEP